MDHGSGLKLELLHQRQLLHLLRLVFKHDAVKRGELLVERRGELTEILGEEEVEGVRVGEGVVGDVVFFWWRG